MKRDSSACLYPEIIHKKVKNDGRFFFITNKIGYDLPTDGSSTGVALLPFNKWVQQEIVFGVFERI